MPAIENTKLCTLCGKPVGADHYAGLPSRHKECHKARMRQVRADKIDHYREYDRRRFQEDPERRARQLASMRATRDAAKMFQAQRDYRSSHPEKEGAKRAIAYAVLTGKISKPCWCEICGSADKLHAHHHDYSKRLDVWWLCEHCHKLLHRLIRSAMRKSEAA